jgi:hypothetical protein
MQRWILEHLGIVIFAVIFLTQIVRGVLRTRRDRPASQSKPNEFEEQRRVQEIQEQIRRRIAERRGQRMPPAAAPSARREAAPPPLLPRPETTQMPSPFEGPLRRMFEEIERKVQPAPEPAPVSATVEHHERHAGELERQRRLAEEIRTLAEARAQAQRRAAQLAAEKEAAATSETGLRTAARERLLGDLRDPQTVRRAFVLREVLGAPVGLR